MRTVMLLAVTIGLLPAVTSGAATPEAPPTTESLAPSLAQRIPEGRTVRLVLDSRTLVCRSPSFTPDGIALPSPAPGGPGYGTPALLPWREVERIDVRGNSARTGAVIGGVAVGLLGVAFGAAVASDPFLGGDGSGVLVLAAMGVATGAGVGAVVGSAIPSWRNVYRRDAQTDGQREGAGPSGGTRP